jgi:hypothetical protein
MSFATTTINTWSDVSNDDNDIASL